MTVAKSRVPTSLAECGVLWRRGGEDQFTAARVGGVLLDAMGRERARDDGGRLLPATVAGKSAYAQGIEEAGISERTARYWQQVALIPMGKETKYKKTTDSPTLMGLIEYGTKEEKIERDFKLIEAHPEKKKEFLKGKKTATELASEIRAESRAKKKLTTAVQEDPRVVKEYMALLTALYRGFNMAIEAADQSRFSPEAAQWVRTSHKNIRDKFTELERKMPRNG